MATTRKVEVFKAECPVCEPTVELVNKLACSSCKVTVDNLREGCITNQCLDKVKLYGITRLPAAAVNGNLLKCRKVGQISEHELRAAGIGTV